MVDDVVSSDHGQAYGQWIAPKSDGDLLVWPDAASLADTAKETRRALDAALVALLDRPLGEWRTEMRSFLGAGDGPVVMTGHQSELHHPGVWVKNAVIHAVAEAAGGSAWHVAVDTDAPKHLKLRWPGFVGKISDDPRLHGAAWTGQLEPPTPAHLDELLAADGLPKNVESFLLDIRRYLIDQRDGPSPMNLPAAMADAFHKLDWSLGLRYSTVMASGLFESPGWAATVLHVAGDAERFAQHYNAALAGHRSDRGITDADRPMPDLTTGELPFWFDDLDTGVRERATVKRDGDTLVINDRLTLPDSPMLLLMAMRRQRVRLASRALSLTMFARLMCSDLFIHGIGGGHYDDVLDRLIRSYFGMEPPQFVVATATLVHPDAASADRVCPPCIEQEGHRLRHVVLGDDKAAWLKSIIAADTFRARREIFDAMHAERHRRLATDDRYQQWLRRRDELEQQREREAVLFDRELFYGVQTDERLLDLIDRVASAVNVVE